MHRDIYPLSEERRAYVHPVKKRNIAPAVIFTLLAAIFAVCGKKANRKSRLPEHVAFSKAEDIHYFDDEIIVISRPSVTDGDIRELAGKYKAKVRRSTPGIGLYLFAFENAVPYGELKKLIEAIRKEALVDAAYLNIVIDPVFPDRLTKI